MSALLLLINNAGPASVSNLLLELLPPLIGMKIHSCAHGGVAKNVVANNYILRDRFNHGSLPHYQFMFEPPNLFWDCETSYFHYLNPALGDSGPTNLTKKVSTKILVTL